MKAECVAASVLLTIVFVAAAHADCKKGEVLRTNTRGQPQCIKQGRTFNECVQDPNLRASNTNCSSIVRASNRRLVIFFATDHDRVQPGSSASCCF
jgi:hypothetical protein